MRDGTHGKSGPKGNSALTGPDRGLGFTVNPSGLAWTAGAMTIRGLLPTATQRQPLRGSDGDRDGRKASGMGDPALRDHTHQATRLPGGI